MVLQSGEHPKRSELFDFLEGIAGVSELIRFEERDLEIEIYQSGVDVSIMIFKIDVKQKPIICGSG